MLPTEATLDWRIWCCFFFLVSNLSQTIKESGQRLSRSQFCHTNAWCANTVFILNFPKPGGKTLICTNVSSSWGKGSPINSALFILGRMHIHHTSYSQRHHTQISKMIFIGAHAWISFHFIYTSHILLPTPYPPHFCLVFSSNFHWFWLELYSIFSPWS